MKGMKGCPIGGKTHEKIMEHVRKHRAKGGEVESPKEGTDDAMADLKDKPKRYNNSKVEDEAEATKAKRGGKVDGKRAHHHSGRKKRASGGGCESNPFTTAQKGSGPREKKTEKESEGMNV